MYIFSSAHPLTSANSLYDLLQSWKFVLMNFFTYENGSFDSCFPSWFMPEEVWQHVLCKGYWHVRLLTLPYLLTAFFLILVPSLLWWNGYISRQKLMGQKPGVYRNQQKKENNVDGENWHPKVVLWLLQTGEAYMSPPLHTDTLMHTYIHINDKYGVKIKMRSWKKWKWQGVFLLPGSFLWISRKTMSI